MKKNLLKLLLVSVSTLSLASCGETPSVPESSSSESASRNNYDGAWQIPDEGFDRTKEVTVNFYSTMGKDLQAVFTAYLEDFNKIYPNIIVNHTQPGSYDDVLDQVKTELSVGDGPDLAYCYADHVALYNKTKAVVTLDNLAEDDDLGFTSDEYKDFVAGYYQEGKSFGDGLTYTLPWSKSTEILYYNKTVFDKEGLSVPTHWFSNGANDTTSMEYVCTTLKEKYPNSIPLGYDSEANWFITMCEQLQSNYTSASGANHYLFVNDTNKDFVNKFKSWFDKSLVTTSTLYGNYTSGLFTETVEGKQNSFMSIGSSAGATHQIPATLSDGSEAFEVGMASIPQANENNPKVISQGPSVCVFNHGDSQKVMAAWLVAKFFTTNTAFQAEFSMKSGYVPVIKSVNDNETYQKFLAEGNDLSKPQSTRAPAIAAKLCLEQEAAYYSSPAFIGSSQARTEVGKIITQLFSNSVDSVDKAFEDAYNNCIANS